MTKPLLRFGYSGATSIVASLAVTAGEPAGIGPELVVALALRSRDHPWIAVASMDLLSERARMLGVDIVLDQNLEHPSMEAGTLTVHHVDLASPSVPGICDSKNSKYVLDTLRFATDECLSGHYRGMVTGPVQKSVINEAGYKFSGHTEFLSRKAGTGEVVMLLVAGELRVAIATTHLPLAEVPKAISRNLIRGQLQVLLNGLKERFGLLQPRVLVAGLNPHAGEGGHMGSEEIDIIAPICEEFRMIGEDIVGPIPADTLFTKRWLSGADAVLAMYHDQGLPVLKYEGFGRAVNVTLGLPFVRTSVDHGTALDLAGSGEADPGSLYEAIKLADKLSWISSGRP